jgi:hypothetical protein
MGAGSNLFNAGGSSIGKFASSADPYVQASQATSTANMLGAQQATTANRVNQSTPYQSLQYTQKGTDAYGNPIWSATQSLNPQFQGTLSNLAQNVGQTTQNAFAPTNLPSMGINPGQTYSDAIMQRLQPQIQMQQKQFDAQMANQGIAPGTEAYNNAQRQFGQQQNDLLTSAQIGGIGVGTTANQQAFNQQLQQYNNPLQQLGAFNQATQANYINPYTQAAVAGPDYLGATTASNAAALAAQNAKNAQTAATQSGLYSLGSAALMGGGGLGGLLNTGSGVVGGLSNLLGSAGNTISKLFGSNNYDYSNLNNIYGADNVYGNGGGYLPTAADYANAWQTDLGSGSY